MRLKTYRRTSQVLFTILTLTGVIVGTTGIIYPYFFCYSCPWGVGACPIGILEHGFVDLELAGLMTGLALLLFLFGFMFLMGIIFGRAFCGWVCPIGLMQDLTKKLGISKKLGKKLGPKEIDPRVKYIKYLILISIPITSYLTLSLFYTTFCPVGGLTGTVPTLLVYGGDWLLGTTFPLKMASVGLFIALIILVTRGWCKYLCPVGAMLAPWNKLSALRVKRNEETCNDCGLCEQECPMDVKDIGIKDNMECILCGRCVTVCRQDSLKLGYRFAGAGYKGLALFLSIILISSAMLAVGIWNGGYERTDAINDIPCLGCLALDPKSPEGWFAVDELPEFIMEHLVDRPVMIDFRTTVCAACDEMDPHVHDLAEEYEGRVHFIMHPENFENLDDYPTDSDEYQSYFIFDVKGEPGEITGVPLFPIITYGVNENGTVGIIFKVLYGSSADGGITQKANIAQALDEAIALHDLYGGGTVYYSGEQIPFVELFVAIECANCPKSEEALLDLIEEDDYVNFVSYVGDAPGESGVQALEREYYLAEKVNLSVIGRPWAVFGGGPGFERNAESQAAVTQIYRDKINATYLEPLNVSLTGAMIDNTNDLGLNLSIAHDDNNTQSLRVQVFILEVKSRWLNHYTHHPIPYAVVDIPVNNTYDIANGTVEEVSMTWTGTNDLSYSDFRISNLAAMIVVWKGENQVTSKLIESGIPESMWMVSAQPVQSALPNNTANYTLTLHNDRGTAMTINLSAMSVPSSVSINISQSSVTIPANSQVDVPVTVTGTDTMIGDTPSFMIHAEDVTDTTLSSTVILQMLVKGDNAPPVIVNVEHSPDSVNADQAIEITATVGDNVAIESVVLQYYSCDDLACSPTFTVPMALQSGKYVPVEEVKPRELYHNIFHYWIVAEDTSGNIIRTQEYDVTVTPVESPDDHDDDVSGTSPYNTQGIGLVIIFAMVAIGLNIARVVGKEPKEVQPKKEEPHDHETEAEEGPEDSTEAE